MYDPDLLRNAEKIEDYLDDDISKRIFRYRLLANLTNDVRYIHQMHSELGIFQFEKAYEMFQRIDNAYHIYTQLDVLSFIQTRNDAQAPIVLFGAGHDAELYYSLLNVANVHVDAVIDNYSDRELFHGLRVYKPFEYKELTNAIVVITSWKFRHGMYWEMIARKVPEDHIFVPAENALNVFSMQEYFDEDIWKGREHEIFIDAGAYNLNTSIDFTRFAKSYDKIYAFEPDSDNYSLCEEQFNHTKVKNVEIINAGLWHRDEVLRFARGGDNGTGTAVKNDGDYELQVKALDNFLDGKPCTFIKMDIEGSELEALKGAEKTIIKYKPRLAICLYHKPMDLIEIPLYIKEIVPDYKIKIRHYSTCFYDTVLYAE